MSNGTNDSVGLILDCVSVGNSHNNNLNKKKKRNRDNTTQTEEIEKGQENKTL